MGKSKRKCDRCGNVIDEIRKFVMSQYGYKYGGKVFCGYKCYNEHIAEIEKAKNAKVGIL